MGIDPLSHGMKIGIDISQIVHEGTGVATYVKHIVAALVRRFPEHEYVLFGASLRKRGAFLAYANNLPAIRLVTIPLPPTVLEIVWNRLHIFPIEWFTGPLDVFWSSDWTQPPLARARGVTTIHDLSVFKFPKESHEKIVATQRRKLALSAKTCSAFFCDSEATKKDAHELLGITHQKLYVVYPGLKRYGAHRRVR